MAWYDLKNRAEKNPWKVPAWHFWNPASGLFGGMIMGCVIGIALLFIELSFIG